MSARKPPIDMRFVPTAGFPELDQAADRSAPGGPSPGAIALGGGIRDQAADAVLRQPTRCMLLRTDGELSLLDLDRGSERALVAGVEHFWLTGPRAREEELLMEEVPWWAYGHRGMQVRGGGRDGGDLWLVGRLGSSRSSERCPWLEHLPLCFHVGSQRAVGTGVGTSFGVVGWAVFLNGVAGFCRRMQCGSWDETLHFRSKGAEPRL
jgi:hypothetical protein